MLRLPSQTGARILPSRADILALMADIAAIDGPSPAMDFRIAELFDLAPDPDAYGSELTPYGNGFDWRAPPFTADLAAVGDLARHLCVDLAPSAPATATPLETLAALLAALAGRG